MRLYLFEHCSICFRVRMAAALKHLHLQETVLLEDDSEAMIKLVGKRVVPILVKDDGQPMLESMDMVAHIDSIGEPILVGPQRSELAAWASATADKTAPLTWPRYPLLGLPEFSTIAAHDHFVVRKQKRLGDLVELRARTRELIEALMPNLEKLDGMIESAARSTASFRSMTFASCRCCARPPWSRACAFRTRSATILKP